MGSERLAGKVLMNLAGRPLLWHVVERAGALRYAQTVVLATSTAADDDILAETAQSWGVTVFRGSEFDVLDRYYQAALLHGASLIYRMNGDNPLADPYLADRLYESHSQSPCDYLWIEGAAIGLGAELMTRRALEIAWKKAVGVEDREHVTTSIRRGEVGETRSVQVPPGYPLPADYRLTVDTAVDFELMSRIYEELYQPGRIIPVGEVRELLSSKPDLLDLSSA
jgi:spore coat polysaccharide biosynthesis protein SpsF